MFNLEHFSFWEVLIVGKPAAETGTMVPVFRGPFHKVPYTSQASRAAWTILGSVVGRV